MNNLWCEVVGKRINASNRNVAIKNCLRLWSTDSQLALSLPTIVEKNGYINGHVREEEIIAVMEEFPHTELIFFTSLSVEKEEHLDFIKKPHQEWENLEIVAEVFCRDSMPPDLVKFVKKCLGKEPPMYTFDEYEFLDDPDTMTCDALFYGCRVCMCYFDYKVKPILDLTKTDYKEHKKDVWHLMAKAKSNGKEWDRDLLHNFKVKILYPNDDENNTEINSDNNSENNSEDRPLTNA